MIIAIYDNNFKDWYDIKLINSKLPIEHLLFENQSINFLYDKVKNFECIIFLLENGYHGTKFPFEELLIKLKNTKKLVKICFSNELNLYNFHNLADKQQTHISVANNDYAEQEKYKNKYNVKHISCLINNPNVIYEPSIYLSSFKYLDKNVVELFFNNNKKEFLNGNCRFGIMVNRKSKERYELIKNILNEPLYNDEFITITNAKAYASQIPCYFNNEQMKILVKNSETNITIHPYQINEVKGNKQYETTFTKNYWEDGYAMFCKSKIEVVTETFNHIKDMQEWQYMLTEKTLKTLWAGKPMLHYDPISFQLFETWGFEIDKELYGDDLVNLFKNFDKNYIQNTKKWLIPFTNRLKEIDKISENVFNKMYNNSILIAERNRQKVISWEMWYDNIEKWFDNE
jgi:hypothetical protein